MVWPRRLSAGRGLLGQGPLHPAELLELAQWKDAAQVEAALSEPELRARLAEECADVLLYLLLICERRDRARPPWRR